MKLKLLDLFSGIGGFSLGLESTGQFETIAFVEKDEFCKKVLKKNFNNIPIESEVRNVKGDRYAADIITGGFPCQHQQRGITRTWGINQHGNHADLRKT